MPVVPIVYNLYPEFPNTGVPEEIEVRAIGVKDWSVPNTYALSMPSDYH